MATMIIMVFIYYTDGIRVQACRAAVWIQLAFSHFSVMTTQASWLAQMGRGILICQRACRLRQLLLSKPVLGIVVTLSKLIVDTVKPNWRKGPSCKWTKNDIPCFWYCPPYPVVTHMHFTAATLLYRNCHTCLYRWGSMLDLTCLLGEFQLCC